MPNPAIIAAYARLVQAGRRTMDTIPDAYRAAVAAALGEEEG